MRLPKFPINTRIMRRPFPELSDRNKIPRWNIVKGDQVQIITGKDKGKRGKVSEVLRQRNLVVVEGLNMYKRHPPLPQKKGDDYVVNGAYETERPIHVSNVQLMHPDEDRPTKVFYKKVLEEKSGNPKMVWKRYARRKDGNKDLAKEILKPVIDPPLRDQDDMYSTPLEEAQKRTFFPNFAQLEDDTLIKITGDLRTYRPPKKKVSK